MYSDGLSKLSGGGVFLKCENLQRTGAYKIRGALNKIFSMPKKQFKQGLVAASSGNFGQGIALAGKMLKVKLAVFVPKVTPKIKINNIKNFGAQVFVEGANYMNAENLAKEYAKKNKMIFVSPYNDVDVLKGYGTIANEVLKDLPSFDYFLAPTGAGSIISACGPILKKKLKNFKIIAVQAINTPTMYDIFYHKNLAEKNTLAEGLAGGIEKGSITVGLTKKYASKVILVSEEEIKKAILWTLKKEHMLVEGATATVIAAVLFSKLNLINKKAVLVLSGGNLDLEELKRLL